MPEPIVNPNPAPAAGSPAPEGEVKPGAVATTKKYIVNGKEIEVPLDKIDERVQKSFGAEEAMKKASELDKAFNNFISQAQDPEKLLALLQHPSLKYDEEKQELLVSKIMAAKNPRVITAVKRWIYENEIAPAMMDPKERELAEKNARLDKYEKDENERKSREASTQKELAIQKAWNTYRVTIGEGLKAEGLPPTEATVARVARYALLQSRAKKPVDIADCVKRVKADIVHEHDERWTGADDDKILDMLPDKLAERIHKAYLKRLTKNDPQAPVKKEEGKNTEDLNVMMRKLSRGQQAFKD